MNFLIYYSIYVYKCFLLYVIFFIFVLSTTKHENRVKRDLFKTNENYNINLNLI